MLPRHTTLPFLSSHMLNASSSVRYFLCLTTGHSPNFPKLSLAWLKSSTNTYSRRFWVLAYLILSIYWGGGGFLDVKLILYLKIFNVYILSLIIECCYVDTWCQPSVFFLKGASPVAQMVKESAYNAGDPGSIPGSGRSPGEGNGNPLLYFCLGNPWTEGPGRLQSMGSQRIRHNWVTNIYTGWLKAPGSSRYS